MAETPQASLRLAFAKSLQYEQVGDYEKAINSMLILEKSTPLDYTLNLRLGYLFTANKKYANAITHYQIAHKVAPRAVSPQIGLMRIMNIQGKYAETEALGFSLLQSDYYNYYGNLYLTYALRMNKKWEAAREIDLRMLSAYPTDKHYLLEYGLLSRTEGNNKAANKALHFLLMLDPENIKAKETLSQINTFTSASSK
jgi:tetratricopeptide (TPR) repeat protein